MAEGNESAVPDPGRNTPLAPMRPDTWEVMATSNGLVLARSEREYALYDRKNNFGRWPLTDEGYRFATRTYEAHSQSLAHGISYTAAGYRDQPT